MSMQKKITEAIRALVEKEGFELLVNYNYANTGTMQVQPKGEFKTIMNFGFHFNPGYVVFTFNSDPAPFGRVERFGYVAYNDDKRIKDFLGYVGERVKGTKS